MAELGREHAVLGSDVALGDGSAINRDFRVDVSRVGNVARVSVEDITDGRFADMQPLTLTLTAPGGSTSQAELRQVAGRQYEATVVADTPGVYQVTVAEPNQPRVPGRSDPMALSCSGTETASFVANEQSLRRIASETGGTLLDGQAPALYQGPRAATATRWIPIWSIFMVVGLLAFLLDVAVRRLRPSTLRALFGKGHQ